MEYPGIPRLTPEEVKARLDQAVVDVRKASVYARGNISGAICLPITDLQSSLDELPSGKSLIFYCT
jgi:rhodanese-related sulfurtransferase